MAVLPTQWKRSAYIHISSILQLLYICLTYITISSSYCFYIHTYIHNKHHIIHTYLEYLAQSTNHLLAVLPCGQEELVDIVESHPPVNMTEPLE